jgi:galactose mutarotase-like enzyme
MHILENSNLIVEISAQGAELQRIFGKAWNQEYLWDGDPAFWSKKSPVLFPIVGSLKENRYFYQGKPYSLSRHGFARDLPFEPLETAKERIHFQLKSNEKTLEQYPFSFRFRIGYRLQGPELRVSYEVINDSAGPMYFSLGGHPAFRLPLTPDTEYSDYFLEFNEEEVKPRWPISPEGLIENSSVPLLESSSILPLRKELFWQDALVLKHPTSSILSLKSDKTERGIDIAIGEFPYLGIWAAKNADFICIEPWCGIADTVGTDQELEHKEGIEWLLPGKVFRRAWTAGFY